MSGSTIVNTTFMSILTFWLNYSFFVLLVTVLKLHYHNSQFFLLFIILEKQMYFKKKANVILGKRNLISKVGRKAWTFPLQILKLLTFNTIRRKFMRKRSFFIILDENSKSKPHFHSKNSHFLKYKFNSIVCTLSLYP